MLSTVNSYVPVLIRQRVANSSAPLESPEYQAMDAAVLYADISGFTQFADNLASEGALGVEKISAALNEYFGRWIDVINQHGGDVVKFAGDALLAIWRADDARDLNAAARQASACALEAHAALRGYKTAEGVQLVIHTGVAMGRVEATYLGGMYKRWEMLFAGEAISQVSVTMQQAAPGAIAVTAQVKKALGKDAQTEPTTQGCFILSQLNAKSPNGYSAADLFEAPLEAQKALEAYIPGAIKERIAAGQVGWLAELRDVSVLFINLPVFDYQTELQKAQETIYQIQKTLYHYEGSINKIIVDEKGTTLLAVFGLPPFSHEDDALRATLAVLDIQKKLEAYDARLSMGVASGQAFCGSIGNETRREYTVIGQTVNLAARLMQAAAKAAPSGQRILICESTAKSVKSRIMLEALKPIVVKGKKEAIPVFRPQGEVLRQTRAQAEIVGRNVEREKIRKSILEFRSSNGENAPRVFIFEGDPGIGKTCLLEDALFQAQEAGVTALAGEADAIEKATPYFVWRQIFASVFDVNFNEPAQTRQEKIAAALDADLLERAALLNDLLQVDFPHANLTAHMEGALLTENIRETFIDILRRSASQSPKLIAIEDVHWLDTASWALLASVARLTLEIPLLLMLTIRPLTDVDVAEFRQIQNLPTLHYFKLERMPESEILELVSRKLGVDGLPQPVNELIIKKAEGHPFFSEELARALRDSGVLVIENGTCQLAAGFGNLEALDLPKTVQGVVLSRIDRLAPSLQLTLKVASVIGRIFAYAALNAVYPIEEERGSLRPVLKKLQELDITALEAPDPDLAYLFKQSITRDVAYNLMLFSQRRQLHKSIAEWCESIYAADLEQYYGMLAHHYTLAEEADKALIYLEKAGRQTLAGGAYLEALNYFEEALRVADEKRIAVNVQTRAAWEHNIGEAYMGLGMLEKSKERLEKSVELLGYPSPKQKGRLALKLLSQAATQAWRLTRNALPRPAENEEKILAAARSHERLVELYYYSQDLTRFLNSGLYSLNLSQQTTKLPDLARAYIMACTVCSIIPVHSLAKKYERLALEAVEKTDHLPSLARISSRSGLYNMGIGNFDKAIQALEKAAEISEKLRDHRLHGESASLRAWTAYLLADFEDNRRRFESTFDAAKRVNNEQYQVWGYWGKSHGLLRLGRLDEAKEALAQIIHMLENGNEDRGAEILAYGMSSIVCLYQQDWANALKYGKLVARVKQTFSVAYLEGWAGSAETFLTLWEKETTNAGFLSALNYSLDECKADARLTCKASNRYARIYPIGKPRAALLNGWLALLNGKRAEAFKYWNEGLKSAEDLGLRYEQARLHHILSRHLPAADSTAQTRRDTARQIFTEINAHFDLENF